jgi:cytochrome c peroxidase
MIFNQTDHSTKLMLRGLKGSWTHLKGGFFHDGRFATLMDVINHYNDFKKLGLNEAEKKDLLEYLKSL